MRALIGDFVRTVYTSMYLYVYIRVQRLQIIIISHVDVDRRQAGPMRISLGGDIQFCSVIVVIDCNRYSEYVRTGTESTPELRTAAMVAIEKSDEQ